MLPAVREVATAAPGAKIFLDQYELDHGVAWQEKIYSALARCRRVAACYSPAYVASKMCQEEFNLARIRHREEGDVLLPVFLHTAELPLHCRDIQYRDCREGDGALLCEALRGSVGT